MFKLVRRLQIFGVNLQIEYWLFLSSSVRYPSHDDIQQTTYRNQWGEREIEPFDGIRPPASFFPAVLPVIILTHIQHDHDYRGHKKNYLEK